MKTKRSVPGKEVGADLRVRSGKKGVKMKSWGCGKQLLIFFLN